MAFLCALGIQACISRMTGHCRVVEPWTFNRLLDEKLLGTGLVDREIFLQFKDAYTYDAATSVGWLEAKLTVLVGRLRKGGELKLHEPGQIMEVDTFNEASFSDWVDRHFPDLGEGYLREHP